MKAIARTSLFLPLVLISCVGCNKAKTPAAISEVPDENQPVANQTSEQGNWALESWNQTVEGTQKRVQELYDAAKKQGTTHARSASEWVTEDWSSKGDWQYKIVQINGDQLSESENALNELGKDRWECFHVERDGGQTTFFFKRSKVSYLKNLPLRDLANLIPFLGSDGDGGQQ